MANIYGSVGNTSYEQNKQTRENNGYHNKYDDDFYLNGPKYNQDVINKEIEQIKKQQRDNAIGAIILIIIIIVLLVIFVIPNIVKGV